MQLVDLNHAGQQLERIARIARKLLECRDVLREATTAIANAWPQEALTDARVHTHPARHLLNIGTDAFADVGNLVDEGDLRRQKCVRGQLDHLGRRNIGRQNRSVEILIEARHALHVVRPIPTHHDPVGLAKIGDRRALAQKLWIRDVANILAAACIQLGAHASACAHRHG